MNHSFECYIRELKQANQHINLTMMLPNQYYLIHKSCALIDSHHHMKLNKLTMYLLSNRIQDMDLDYKYDLYQVLMLDIIPDELPIDPSMLDRHGAYDISHH